MAELLLSCLASTTLYLAPGMKPIASDSFTHFTETTGHIYKAPCLNMGSRQLSLSPTIYGVHVEVVDIGCAQWVRSQD
jgi:hypothetical protein